MFFRAIVACLCACLATFTIPGIATAGPMILSAEEQAWRQAHPVVQVGVYTGDQMPFESWQGGQPEGIGIDHLKLLAAHAGLQLQFHPYNDWAAISYGTQPLPFDLLPAQPLTPSRAERFNMLRPFMSDYMALVARRDDDAIRLDGDLAGKRVVLERRFRWVVVEMERRFPHAMFMLADDAQQAMDMVEHRGADVYIGMTTSRTALQLQRRAGDALRMVAATNFPVTEIAPAVNKDRELLTRILDRADVEITEPERAQLRQRWGVFDGQPSALPSSSKQFSQEQLDWLSRLPELRVGYEVDRYPYSFVDRGGTFNGLAADYMNVLKDRLGLRLKMVPVADWHAMLAMIDARQIDLIVTGNQADTPSTVMRFSHAYESFPYVIVSRLRGAVITGPNDLVDRTIAIRDEPSVVAQMRMLSPRSVLRTVPSTEAGLAMVSSGGADAYVGTLPAIDAMIRNRYAAELHVVGPAGLDQEFGIGVASQYDGLLPMIDRVLAGMDQRERQAIRGRWLTVDYTYGVPWPWVIGGLVIVALFFTAIALAYRRLKRESQARGQAEARLAEQLDFQHAMLETLPYPVFVKDAQGRYLAINSAYERRFRCSRDDLIGRTMSEGGHMSDMSPSMQDNVHRSDQAVLTGGTSRETELQIPQGAGQPSQSVMLWQRPFVSRSGDRRLLGTLVDVSEIRAQEEALTQAMAEAKAANAAKSTFLAVMSHEIRTPMAGVLGLIELFAHTPLDNEQSQMLDLMEESATALLQILDEILDYSRIDANELGLEKAEFDLRALIDSIAGLFSVRLLDNDLSMYSIQDPRMAELFEGDPVRIRQIIANLMSNALKFSRHGRIILRMEVREQTPDRQLVRIVVDDSGIGIAPDELARLFKPFTQAEQSTARRFGGTGLGLSISRRLAELMGGHLHLESTLGEGTRAILDLPLAVAKPMEPLPALAGKRALVACNDETRCDELLPALCAMGFDARRANAMHVSEWERADLYAVDTRNMIPAGAPDSVPRLLLSDSGPHVAGRDFPLRGNPLLWRALRDTCSAIFGVMVHEQKAALSYEKARENFRVLVAEDQPVNRMLIGRQLDLLGYSHAIVENGREALEMLAKGEYALLLTDCHMPEMDGYELSQRIREGEAPGEHLPIIALSADALPEQVGRCRQAGMDDFLAKPVRLRELSDKLALYCADAVARDDVPSLAPVDNDVPVISEVYRDPAQLHALLNELMSSCQKDVEQLQRIPPGDDEERQRFLLHRIEGALGVVGPWIDGGERTADASVASRRAALPARMNRLRTLVEQSARAIA